jgi:hypothetical protein
MNTTKKLPLENRIQNLLIGAGWWQYAQINNLNNQLANFFLEGGGGCVCSKILFCV